MWWRRPFGNRIKSRNLLTVADLKRAARGGRRPLQLEALEERTLLDVGGFLQADMVLGFSHQEVAVAGELVVSSVTIDDRAQDLIDAITTTGSTQPIYVVGELAEAGMGAISPATDESTSQINLDAFRADARFAGIDGSGFATVILDTGIDLNHPFFGPDVAPADGIADRIVYSWDFADGDPDASDVDGHGSNVSSIVASQDATYPGMAPGADIIHLKVFTDAGAGSFGVLERALQWVVANAAGYNIASINMSLGDGWNDTTPQTPYGVHDELAALAAMNVMVVSASGNDFFPWGSAQGVAYPSSDPNSLSIGAVYDGNTGAWGYGSGAIAYSTDVDRIAPFSQRHATLTTVMAPGAVITGANQAGGTVDMHGTSQASPHVSGIAVLAQQLAVQELGRRLTQTEYAGLLQSTGVLIHDGAADGNAEDDNVTNTGVWFPRVDVLALGDAIYAMAHLEVDADDDPGGDNVADDGQDDDFLVKLNAAGTDVEVYINGDLFTTAPLADLRSITVNGSGDRDTLTVDFSNGDPIPASPDALTFHGGSGSDTLAVTGGAGFTDVVYDAEASGSGVLTLDGSKITFTGLEPVQVLPVAGTITINIDPGNTHTGPVTSTFNSPGSVLGLDNEVTFSAGGLESLEFNNPTAALIVNGDSADADLIQFNSLHANFDAAITVDGQGADQIDLNTPLNLGASSTGDVSLTAGDIRFTETLSTTGAAVLNALTGSIDSDSLDTDLAASTAVLRAGNGIWLETEVDNLEADGGAGGVFIDEADDLTIGGISPLEGISGNEIGIFTPGNLTISEPVVNPSGTDYTDLGGFDVTVNAPIRTYGSSASIDADNRLELHSTIDTDGGWLDLWAMDDDLLIDGSIFTGGGDLYVYVSRDIVLTSTALVDAEFSPSASWPYFEFRAFGGVTMADGSLINARDGWILIDVDNDVIVGELIGGWEVEVYTNFGSIFDGGDTGTDITSDWVELWLGGSIGTAVNAIDTDANYLFASAWGGGIYVDNAGPLTLGYDPWWPTEAAGDVEISATSPMVVAGDVLAGGSITLTAFDSAAPGDDLTVNAGLTVQASGGDVTLRAGDNIELPSGSTVGAAGKVTLEGDFGDADPGTGSTINVFGTLNTVTQADVLGEADDDNINLDPDLTTGSIRVDGQGGDDSYFVQLGNLGGQVDVDDQSGEGGDDLTIHGTAGDDTLTVDATQTTLATPAQTVTYTANLEELTVDTLGGEDAINVSPSSTMIITVDGGAPGFAALPGGDSLSVDVTGIPVTDFTTITTGPGAGIVQVNSMAPITYADIEKFDTIGGLADVYVNAYADPGGDNVANDGQADEFELVLNGGLLELYINGDLAQTFDPGSLLTILLDGSSDADTFTIDNSGGLIVLGQGMIGQGIVVDGEGVGNNPPGTVDALVIEGDPGIAIGRETYVTGPSVPGLPPIYGPLNPDAGLVILDPDPVVGVGYPDFADVDGDEQVILFDDLAPIFDTTPAVQLDIFLTPGADMVDVVNGPGIGPFVTTEVNDRGFGLFESIEFARKTVVTVNGLNGPDEMRVNNPNPADGLTALGLFGNELTGGLLNPDDNASDRFDIEATAWFVPVDAFGQGGNDLFDVENAGDVDDILGDVTVDGGAGDDDLVVDDTGSAGGSELVTITGTTIDGITGGGGGGRITYLSLDGGTVTVSSNGAGHVYSVESTAPGLAETELNTGGGNDEITIRDVASAIANGVVSPIDLNAQGGVDDRLRIYDGDDPAANTFHMNATQIGGGAFGGPVTPGGIFGPGGILAYDGDLERLLAIGPNDAGLANTYNVDGTGVGLTSGAGLAEIEDGRGSGVFNIQADQLAPPADQNFGGRAGNDTFNVYLAAGAVVTGNSVVIHGDLPAPVNFPERDLVNVIDAGGARNTTITYPTVVNQLVEVQIDAGTLLELGTVERVNYLGDAANDDDVTVIGTAGDDDLTVVPQSLNSALVFIEGHPWDGPGDGDFFGAVPGIAGGGSDPDLFLDGVSADLDPGPGVDSGLNVDGGGMANGDRLYFYGTNERNIEDDGDTTDGNGNVVIPGVGAGNAYDTIRMSDRQVSIFNNLAGQLLPVDIVTASFVQAPGFEDVPGLVVNSGFEELPNPGPVTPPPVGVADDVRAVLSNFFALRLNGGDPVPPFTPQGDRLQVDTPAEVNIFSDKRNPPNVTINSGGSFNLTWSSIENVVLTPGPGSQTVNIYGDNNDPDVDQPDNYVIVGRDVDSMLDPIPGAQPSFQPDADGDNEFFLEINGSAPIGFRNVATLNAYGDDAALTDSSLMARTRDEGDNDTLDITPYADDTPQGWGIDVYYNEGMPDQTDGEQADLIILHTSLLGGEVSEDIVIQPAGPESGEIVVTNASFGTPIVDIDYVSNLDIIVLDDDGFANDTDTLTLRGTNPDNPLTSGNEWVTADLTALGGLTSPKITVADGNPIVAPAPLLYRVRDFQGFASLHFELLGGHDAVDLTPGTIPVFLDGGDPVASDSLSVMMPGSATVHQGADSTTGAISGGAPVGLVNYANFEVLNVNSMGEFDTLVVRATDDNDAIAAQPAGQAPGGTVWVNDGPMIQFNTLSSGFRYLHLEGRFGDDRFSTTPIYGVSMTVDGGLPDGSDELIVSGVTGTPDNAGWTPFSGDSGLLELSGSHIFVQGIESLVFDGGGEGENLTVYGDGLDPFLGTDDWFIHTPGGAFDAGRVDLTSSPEFGPTVTMLGIRYEDLGWPGRITIDGKTALLPIDQRDSLLFLGTPADDVISASSSTTDSLSFTLSGHLSVLGRDVESYEIDALEGDDEVSWQGQVDLSDLGHLRIRGGGPGGSDKLSVFFEYGQVTDVEVMPRAADPNDQFISGLRPTDLYANGVVVSGMELISFQGSERDDSLTVNPGRGDNAVRVERSDTGDRVTSDSLPPIEFLLMDTFEVKSSDGIDEVTFVTGALAGANNYQAALQPQDTLVIEGADGRTDHYVVTNPAVGAAAVTDNSPGSTGVTVTDRFGAGLLRINTLGGEDQVDVDLASGLSVPISVDGGDPIGVIQSTGDALNVITGGAAFEYVHGPEADEGSFLVAGAEVISFDHIEEFLVDGVLFVLPDEFEPNDSIADATVLGSLPKITLRDLTIHEVQLDDPADPEQGPVTNDDYFQITAQDTGKLVINVFFDDDGEYGNRLDGDLDVEVLDADGNFIAGSFGITDDEQVIIPVVSQEVYFLHVYSFAGDPNTYDLEIENFAAPVPSGVTLDPDDDSGSSLLDNVTNVQTPTFFIQADLLDFEAEFNLPPDMFPLPSGTIDSNGLPGADVDVLIFGVDTGTAVTGSATRIGPVKWSFTSPVSLPDDLYEVSARVAITDGQGTPVTGFTQFSAPMEVIVDTTPPADADITIFLVPSSDTGTYGDGITSIDEPAFTGLAEANATIRVYADDGQSGPVLVGVGVVGSDESDVGVGGAADDNRGIWEVTVEPLADGDYTITLEVEDLAGNVTEATDSVEITVDSTSPQRPTIDLVNTDDTGSSDLDNVTIGDPDVLPQTQVADFRISAELGSTVVIKDGEVVIDTFVFDAAFDATDGVPGDGFGIRRIDFAANEVALSIPAEGPHPLSAESTDAAGNFTQSEELLVEIDTTRPATPGTPDLLQSSDTFDDVLGLFGPVWSGSDNLTAINQPAFRGTGEANAIVRVWASPAGGGLLLIGEGVVGSDESDVVPNNGLGIWEITVEPLADGNYEVRVELEDLAGNISLLSDTLSVTIDTLPPQRPTLDLPDVLDTGSSDLDNVTNAPNDVDVVVTAEDGSRVLVKDGEDVIDDFIMAGTTMTRPLTLAEGTHLLSAEAFDVPGNRSAQSEELVVTIDRTDPATPGAADLLASSDTFDNVAGLIGPVWSSSDDVTGINQPAFRGTGEANAIVRVWASPAGGGLLLIGEGVVGSDESDLDPDDGLGIWEITVEPLADGDYDVRVELEDLAGNISGLSEELKVTIDTLPPQRPTLDLAAVDDSGSSDLDNVTYRANDVPVTVTAEAGSRVLVKDGEDVIDDFVMVGTSTVRTLTLAERTHLLSAEAFDEPGNRSAQSEELVLTVDRTPPVDGDVSIFLAPTGDTGVVGDGATSIRQPAFTGLAEANAKLRIYADDGVHGPILVGTGVVGSDESDVGAGGSLADNRGVWEITVEPLADGIYTMTLEVEDLAGNVTSASTSTTIIVDPFEVNDTVETATVLGSLPKITLRDVKLHALAELELLDQDFFQITAQDTGKLVINAFFENDRGDVDVYVVDRFGNFIAGSASGSANAEHLVIPVVGQQRYFLQVVLADDPDGLGNEYDLEIENFAAPVPRRPQFDPNDDSGLSNADLVTFVDDARLFIVADLAEFAAEGIDVLTADQANAGVTPGAAVQVFANGAPVGFADPFFGSTLFAFTLDVTADLDPLVGEWSRAIEIGPDGAPVASDALGYFNMITAAVRIFDGQQNAEELPEPAEGRSQMSDPLSVHFDPNVPDASLATIALATYSDTGDLGDLVTRINQPAFVGVAEANTRLRLYAQRFDEAGNPIGVPDLAGQTVVGSDTSDVGAAGDEAPYIGEGGARDDGLGLWEITVEPLADGYYRLTLEIEDVAGNSSDQDDGPWLDVVIDTLPPQRPTIDLVGPDVVDNDVYGSAPIYSDTGMSTMDNVTQGFLPDRPNDRTAVQVRVSAEPGSTVLIKDGEDVIDTFVMPMPAPGDPVDFVFRVLVLDEDPHPLSVEAFDEAGNRSDQSEELLVTVDLTDPDPANVTLDLLTASDSFGPDGGRLGDGADNVTNINQPAFAGVAEANAQIRLFAERVVDGSPSGIRELVGQGVVNSDQSDGTTTTDPPNTDVLGTWEITVEPLIDGEYQIHVEVEDLAGNITVVDDLLGEDDLVIDTLPPQRPTIDLVDTDDTGSSDLDNVTVGDPDVLPTDSVADFRISAEPGSWVQVKDGEVVIAGFVFGPLFDLTDGVMDGFGILRIDFIANQVAFGIPSEGPHPLSVEAFDVAGNRSAQAEELLVTIDTTQPAAPSMPDLLADSDSGSLDSDNVTNVSSPAFYGLGEANAIVRLWARNATTAGALQLVGEGVVGSDESDLYPADGLGIWEITIEPLDDGVYDLVAELEDLAGNLSLLSDTLRLEIDTYQPNTPFLDLFENDDTGRHNDDNVTNVTLVRHPTFSMTTHDPNAAIHLFPQNFIYRIYDRLEQSAEVLLFDSSTHPSFGGLRAETLLSEVLSAALNNPSPAAPRLADGIHNLKLEVEDRAGNISEDFLLDVLVDTVAPPVNIIGIDPILSDTGVDGHPATFADRVTSNTALGFVGRAEADAIVRLYADPTPDDSVNNPAEFSLTVAVPLDGDEAFPNGQWNTAFLRDLNDPAFFPFDGVREILVTAEDLAGNVNQVGDELGDEGQVLDIFIDTQGPRVEEVFITGESEFDLFDPKYPGGTVSPTPLVHALSISILDLPNRSDVDPNFLYLALQPETATGEPNHYLLEPGHFLLVGDANGIIPIESVVFVSDPVVDDQPATGEIILTFFEPLPDDRFTLTLSDSLVDPAGNALDGETNTIEPQETPDLPSGDGVPGGDFVARFTVDSRPEIGTWSGGSVYVDTNGNFRFDPQNPDFTNRDITYTLGFPSDDIFAGNFALPANNDAGPLSDPVLRADGFDKLAAYGQNDAGRYRWLVDVDNDGVPDINSVEPAWFNGLGAPVAGNFDVGPYNPAGVGLLSDDPSLLNGDEVGLFTGTSWLLDTDRDFLVSDETPIVSDLRGYPIVGDFDGDGYDDLGTFLKGVFYFDLAANGLGGAIDAEIPFSFLAFSGVRERPVAADMNQDGIDDLGLWVPDRSGATPEEGAEWYFLISDASLQKGGSVAPLDHPFEPVPFGDDLFAQFGDDYAAPIVGNFDPPVAASTDPVGPTTQTIKGTDGDDTFELVVDGPGLWTVTVNGVPVAVGASVTTVDLDGLGGKDTVRLTGSAGKDTVELWPGHGTLSGEGYTVNIVDAESITVYGGGGSGVAVLHDDPDGVDTLQADPRAAALSGQGYANRVVSFGDVHAYATPGHDDVAALRDDPAGKDTYEAWPDRAKLSGGGFVIRAKSFRFVHAFSTAGNEDMAVLHDDPNGTDTFKLWPEQAKLYGEGFFTRAKGFRWVHAFSSPGNNDVAVLYDDPNDTDTFKFWPGEGKLYADGFYNRAKGFSQVHAFSSPGNQDIAVLYDDPNGDETFKAWPEEAKLYGDGFFNRAKGFRWVHAYATGGNDTAHLYGSAAKDTLVATSVQVRLSSPEYFNRAVSFDRVYAHGRGGQDAAVLYDAVLETGLTPAPAGVESILWLYEFEHLQQRSASGGDDDGDSETEAVDELFTAYWL